MYTTVWNLPPQEAFEAIITMSKRKYGWFMLDFANATPFPLTRFQDCISSETSVA